MNWIEHNYTNIIIWARNISKGDQLSEELAHYAIEQFLTHKKYEHLSQNPGEAKGFMLAIMRNSWIGAKSEFSRVHKAHRPDLGARKKNITEDKWNQLLDEQVEEEYNYDRDTLIEAIEGLLEEMELDLQGKLWYDAKLFQMYLEDPNYSSLARRTGIPRTSISNAVQEAKEYIILELKNRKII